MQLRIRHKGETIAVNRDNIEYSIESLEYLKTRKSFINAELQSFLREKDGLREKLERYYDNNNILTHGLRDTQETILTRQLSTISFDNSSVEKLLDKVQKELKKVRKQLTYILRTNNLYIEKIFKYVKKYAETLEIDDKIINKTDYIFTDDLKSFSGAVLQKLVFAFKVAFLKVIEESIGCKLIMVLDSPRSKELDNNNFSLIMKIVAEELKENQTFIGSIYDDFDYTKKIELKSRAIEDR